MPRYLDLNNELNQMELDKQLRGGGEDSTGRCHVQPGNGQIGEMGSLPFSSQAKGSFQ